MIRYSIIIPTCSKFLTERCLEYICVLNKPKFEYEVLIVHNVSKENFDDTVASYKYKIPNLRYVWERQYGQLAGRLRGLKEAKGEILCYIDDDSFVDKNWLVEIEKTYSKKDVVMVTGNNLPIYETKPPKWLEYFWTDTPYGKYLDKLSLLKFKNKTTKIPAWFVFGCNFSIKKDIVLNNGGFTQDVVPKDKQRFQGDGETTLSLRLNKAGYYAIFNPKVLIHHFVSSNRMTLAYMKKRAFYQGVCDSFSKIRQENGFDYYDYTPNKNVNYKDFCFIKRTAENFLAPLRYRFLRKYSDAFRTYLEIEKEYKKSYQEGFDFHQNEVKNDPELLKYVLKENYFDFV